MGDGTSAVREGSHSGEAGGEPGHGRWRAGVHLHQRVFGHVPNLRDPSAGSVAAAGPIPAAHPGCGPAGGCHPPA